MKVIISYSNTSINQYSIQDLKKITNIFTKKAKRIKSNADKRNQK